MFNTCGVSFFTIQLRTADQLNKALFLGRRRGWVGGLQEESRDTMGRRVSTDTGRVFWRDMWCRVLKECSHRVKKQQTTQQLRGERRKEKKKKNNSNISLNSGRRDSTCRESEQMCAAKAKLCSLPRTLGSLGFSLMPPGDCRLKRRVNGEQQETCNPKSYRQKKKIIKHLHSMYTARGHTKQGDYSSVI